jgi:serpin B
MKVLKTIVFYSIITLLFIPGMKAQDLSETISGNNEFAFTLYEEINDKEEDVFFSPYSISSALAMTYNGARGETRKEMQELLNFIVNSEALSSHFKELNDKFSNLKRDKIQLNIANSLWCQEDIDFKQNFLDLNKNYYSAGIEKVNFAENYKEIREQINEWVENKTNSKIKELISKGMLDELTRLVLVNAIYFKGMWEFPFEKEKTKEDTFYIYTKCMTKTDFMHRTLSAKYYKDDLAEVIEIPYSGKKLSMMIVMPVEKYGMKKLEERLDAELYESYRQSMYTTKVDLALPKFKIEAGYDLTKPFRELGMESAFNSEADFSGITESEDLYISNIVHKSYVDVNEEGTEAAAATGVVMRKTTAVMKNVKFEADHPFIFFIKDNKTGSILFMGRLMNPED